jgi:glutamate synthase (NADPH) small chain
VAKVTGFLDYARKGPRPRPVTVRLLDWREVYEPQSEEDVTRQGARCMDCGVPFCMQGCPLGNRIPEFNDRLWRGDWHDAASELFATNNFPEFTGRLCPAPCESACVLGINDLPVTIERLEYEVAEHAFSLGFDVGASTPEETGLRVAIVGSGPAGLAAAAQLRSVGHAVSVYERCDAIGGLLRYGIPEFKMEKSILDRRLTVMRAAGIQFFPSVAIGEGSLTLESLRSNHDAVLLALGSTIPRRIDVPGADLEGVVVAMTYLEAANRAVTDGTASMIDAKGCDVVILGGGDTGADCLGTVHRQGAASVTQIEILERPPNERPRDEPWPTMARLFKTTSAHDEGGERRFASETIAFEGSERVERIVLRDRRSGDTVVMPANLVLIAAGFVGPELAALGLDDERFLSSRATLSVGPDWRLAALEGSPVYACGDAVRGQSLIVWAIAEGRSAASAIDERLQGRPSVLAAPVDPYAVSW